MNILDCVKSRLVSEWNKHRGCQPSPVEDNVVDLSVHLIQSQILGYQKNAASLDGRCVYKVDNFFHNIAEFVKVHGEALKYTPVLNDNLRDVLRLAVKNIAQNQDAVDLMATVREIPSVLKEVDFKDEGGNAVKLISFVCAYTGFSKSPVVEGVVEDCSQGNTSERYKPALQAV